MKPDCLVVLGGSVTALAVLRDAQRLDIDSILVGHQNEIAMRSQFGAKVFSTPNDALPGFITELCLKRNVWLIATSDLWLKFIVENRDILDDLFVQILHPSSDSLKICLNKEKFCEFCSKNGFLTPREISADDVVTDSATVKYPLLIRPATKNHGEKNESVPKTVEVINRDEALYWLRFYEKADQLPVMTESLLGRNLVQISVGLAVNGSGSCCFSSIKHRPLPNVCAVGTFVETFTDRVAEKISISLLKHLNYFGIAEVEILKDISTDEYFVIEVNARPWVQYQLGPSSGHPLLEFMYDQKCTIGAGHSCWLNLYSDLYYCFSRSVGHVWSNEVRISSFLFDVFRARNFAYFYLRDMRPFLSMLRANFNDFIRKKNEE